VKESLNSTFPEFVAWN